MKCMACGRLLKSQQSKKLGYGPVCHKKIFGTSLRSSKKVAPLKFDIPSYDIPGQMTLDDYLQTKDR